MSSSTTGSGPGARVAVATSDPGLTIVKVAILGAWSLLVVGAWAGEAGSFHDHLPLGGDPVAWIGLPGFLLSWQLMVVAMMLPASLPALRAFLIGWASPARAPAGALPLGGFLAGYALVWLVFGSVVFAGDAVVHRLAASAPWWAARPWILDGAVLVLAGGYQFARRKRRHLAACRHAGKPERFAGRSSGDPFRDGLDHGLACLGSAWALMLVTLATGFSSPWWMAALTALMVVEAGAADGRRVSVAGGLVLLVLAASVILPGALPSAAA